VPPVRAPDLILGRAVTLGVISAEQRELIAATRLDRELIEEIAARTGIAASVLRMRRVRAERKLLAALERGDLDPDSAAVIATGRARRQRRGEPPASAGPVSAGVRTGRRSPGLTDPDWQVRDRLDRAEPPGRRRERPPGGRPGGRHAGDRTDTPAHRFGVIGGKPRPASPQPPRPAAPPTVDDAPPPQAWGRR
jgi:hypothetical protein